MSQIDDLCRCLVTFDQDRSMTVVVELSEGVTLRPGDILATGTPFGVGGFRNIFLNPGDVVRVELDGVGMLANRVQNALEPIQ